MSSISEQRKQLLYAAISDIWQMIKDFDTMEDTIDYWKSFSERVGIIYNKHGQDDSVKRICLGYFEAKEAECHAKRDTKKRDL